MKIFEDIHIIFDLRKSARTICENLREKKIIQATNSTSRVITTTNIRNQVLLKE
jgi:hypothetical protein